MGFYPYVCICTMNPSLDLTIDVFQVHSQLQAVDNEIDMLLKFKAKLEGSLEATEHPQSVTTSCLTYRQGREGIDMVHDDVEINLLKVCKLTAQC